MKQHRREFLYQSVIISLFTGSGCSAIAKIAMNYPDVYDTDQDIIRQSLLAFATTVIPAGNLHDPHLIKAFSDPYFPFLKIRGYFIYALDKMTDRHYQKTSFYQLHENERTTVIKRGLESKGKKRQLFNAAVSLVQISHYAGIYNAESGCELIDFHGSRFGYNGPGMFYKNTINYMALEQTSSGNYT